MINPYGGSYTGYMPNTVNTPYYPQSQQTNVVSMALVNSEDEARNYPLSPGGSMFLMDSNALMFYTKSVDFSGISTFKKYQFHEVTEAAQAPNNSYVTREEFEELKASINNRNKPYRKERSNESAS